jgi:branched-chain amino acid transport system ATP-binding protein
MASEYILQTNGLTKEFKGFTAVNKVDLKVKRGTIHALIGPNGAGKTTCFNLITKFLQPSAGTILYKDQDITRAQPHAVARMGLVRSFQISAVFPHLTVLENVRVALQRALGTSYHFWRSERSVDVLNERALQLLDDVGVKAYAELPAVELPYGRKRALEIATTLALDPEVLLLDEPMAGMGQRTSSVGADPARCQGPHGVDGRAQPVGGGRSVRPADGAGTRRDPGRGQLCGRLQEPAGGGSLHGYRP